MEAIFALKALMEIPEQFKVRARCVRARVRKGEHHNVMRMEISSWHKLTLEGREPLVESYPSLTPPHLPPPHCEDHPAHGPAGSDGCEATECPRSRPPGATTGDGLASGAAETAARCTPAHLPGISARIRGLRPTASAGRHSLWRATSVWRRRASPICLWSSIAVWLRQHPPAGDGAPAARLCPVFLRGPRTVLWALRGGHEPRHAAQWGTGA